MPAQKRASNNQDEDEYFYPSQQLQRRRRKQSRRAGGELIDVEQKDDQHSQPQQAEEEQEDDSDGSGTDPEAFDEFIAVSRSQIRSNVQCPICLGIIKKTRVVMGCLHRFCRECIDKSMRLGNNECPACRIHCASRRSLRDDPDYDALIDAVYPDVDKYEEEELVLHEEERALNEQIQASIAQISQRQSEALVKRRRFGKDVAATSTSRASRNYQNSYSRRRRNNGSVELQQSDNNESENDGDGDKDISPSDEHGPETKPRRHKKRTGALSNQTPLSAVNPDSGYADTVQPVRENIGNPVGPMQENVSTSGGPVRNPEALSWGRGGARSHTRHGSASSSRGGRSSRLLKLVDHLNNVQTNDDELDVHLQLLPLDEERNPSLKQPYLCCHSSLSVSHLREHIANEITSEAKDIEILWPKEKRVDEKSRINSLSSMVAPNSIMEVVSCSNIMLQPLQSQENLAGIIANCTSHKDLILAYDQK